MKHQVWSCKIGLLTGESVPPGMDAPLRTAVADAFRKVMGQDAGYCFSGWSAELTESELAVVENREPARNPARGRES